MASAWPHFAPSLENVERIRQPKSPLPLRSAFRRRRTRAIETPNWRPLPPPVGSQERQRANSSFRNASAVFSNQSPGAKAAGRCRDDPDFAVPCLAAALALALALRCLRFLLFKAYLHRAVCQLWRIASAWRGCDLGTEGNEGNEEFVRCRS